MILVNNGLGNVFCLFDINPSQEQKMGQVMKLRLFCYLVLLSFDSKTR